MCRADFWLAVSNERRGTHDRAPQQLGGLDNCPFTCGLPPISPMGAARNHARSGVREFQDEGLGNSRTTRASFAVCSSGIGKRCYSKMA